MYKDRKQLVRRFKIESHNSFDVKPNKNFKVAVYVPVRDVQKMKDLQWLKSTYNLLSRYVHIDKVYLEVSRDKFLADEKVILKAKEFFQDSGVKVSGGITYTVPPIDHFRFQTFCYTDPKQRKKAREISEYAAKLFDEVILDDFFFNSCKCAVCVKAKGKKSWTQFRLELMRDAAKNLVVGPAKKINPKVNFIIKYPNWYDHFKYCGFDLETGPKIFDMIYTGTETRDPVYNHQHLQPYESYAIMRYFENVAPGRNGGGWVDPFNRRTLDRYAEQLSLTLFAKSKEITLFCYRAIFHMLKQNNGKEIPVTQIARVAGYALERADSFLGQLGKPLGVKTYKPYNSHGEDFLPNYIGTLGIPMDITPEFPYKENIIFLTEQAGFDKDIVEKIKGQLLKGKDVMITSGLLHKLQGKGIEELVELDYTDKKAMVRRFYNWLAVSPSEYDILIPQIRYATNDSWELITALDNHNGSGYPILLKADYAKGKLYVLTIPDNVGDLYAYPQEILTAIKKILLKNFFVYTDSLSHVSLFVYNNNTFIVASFEEHSLVVKMVVDKKFKKLVELQSGRELKGRAEGDKCVFETYIEPHDYRVFRVE